MIGLPSPWACTASDSAVIHLARTVPVGTVVLLSAAASGCLHLASFEVLESIRRLIGASITVKFFHVWMRFGSLQRYNIRTVLRTAC